MSETDKYLNPYENRERLLREYKKHNNLVIGVDFDATIHDYHKEGYEYTEVKQLLRDLKEIGCTIICWTAYKEHDYVEKYFKDNDLPLDGINCDGIKLPYETRKPFFNALLDDRAGLRSMVEDLRYVVEEVNESNKKGELWYYGVDKLPETKIKEEYGTLCIHMVGLSNDNKQYVHAKCKELVETNNLTIVLASSTTDSKEYKDKFNKLSDLNCYARHIFEHMDYDVLKLSLATNVNVVTQDPSITNDSNLGYFDVFTTIEDAFSNLIKEYEYDVNSCNYDYY